MKTNICSPSLCKDTLEYTRYVGKARADASGKDATAQFRDKSDFIMCPYFRSYLD